MAAAASDPLVLATDAAEALVQDGVPFREAHERVAASVRDGSFTPAGTPAESVAARGAPGPGGVREALAGHGRAFSAENAVKYACDVAGPGGVEGRHHPTLPGGSR